MLEKVERFIPEINRILREGCSKDYIETDKVEKINLKHIFAKVLIEVILVYRVKTSESILDKVACFSEHRRSIRPTLSSMIFSVPA